MGTLNWSGSGHWSRVSGPCVYCGGPTNLRDEAGVPAHKVCAEAVDDFADDYGDDAAHANAMRGFDVGRTA